jgi:hypothetical protein
MATVLELIDAEIEAFHSNVETGSLDDKSPMHSPTPGLARICRLRQLAAGAQRVCQTRNSQQFGEETKLLCAYVDMPLQFVTVYDTMTEGSENG